ncbi:hypothetical protein BACI71_120422 [Bacillus mycoides]|uniref:Uncharacterized protein n=1 Tax=Bacillus mycoides TaxID=1405 RepID=A0A653TF99_BACMY|nr:hypothetical protein BACI71_120422 [Bacillus mycoides]
MFRSVFIMYGKILWALGNRVSYMWIRRIFLRKNIREMRLSYAHISFVLF